MFRCCLQYHTSMTDFMMKQRLGNVLGGNWMSFRWTQTTHLALSKVRASEKLMKALISNADSEQDSQIGYLAPKWGPLTFSFLLSRTHFI
jgi:hypothetical protein